MVVFDKVLVANRGEIAVRVLRTLRELGIGSVAVHSDADANARHVREADEAIRIGRASARESYLCIPAVIEAALRTGVAAIHPGYGFLSENAEFARACEDNGIVFIGPPVEAMRAMGDKIAAKTRVAAAGVPVVPGRHDLGMTDSDLAAACESVGFPALLKPSAGGGGKGMRVVRHSGEVGAAAESARRESRSSFGDDALLVERYIERPRHIEVQVAADRHGNVIHLWERECSLQRRHQKVMEEAPSVWVTPGMRDRMGAAAVDVARSCAYTGVGTVEFIVDSTSAEDFFFLEMNTRLQVEHPVTEAITGIDLVRWQIEIAEGRELPLTQEEVGLTGHAIEARVYAEDPATGFLPSSGRLMLVHEPAEQGSLGRWPAVRVDSAVESGDTVGSDYDPMIAKLIAHGPDRAQALARLHQMLSETAYLGVTTNTAYLGRLLALSDVVNGDLHTGLIDEHTELAAPEDVPDDVLAAAALERLISITPAAPGGDPWMRGDSWRLGPRAWASWRVRGPGAVAVDVFARGTPERAKIRIGDGEVMLASVHASDGRLTVELEGDQRSYWYARTSATLWLSRDGQTWRLVELDRLDAERTESAGVGAVVSPMPGSVIAVYVKPGDPVASGDPLVAVEAMKMEHTLHAKGDGVVLEVPVSVGQQVAMDAELVLLGSRDARGEEETGEHA